MTFCGWGRARARPQPQNAAFYSVLLHLRFRPGLRAALFRLLFPHIFVWGSYFFRSSSARRVSSFSSSSRPPSSSLSHSLTHSLTHSLSLTQLTLTQLTLTHTHSHSLTHADSHSLTHAHSHSLTHTHSHSLTLIHSLTHSLTRSLTHSLTLTHSHSQDDVARAAGGVRNRGRRSTLAMPLRNRGRRSTLAMPLPKSWQAQHSVHLGVCLCGRGRIRQLSRGTGCCRARGGGRAKWWQAQHFGDAVAKSWQAQHFGDAVAEVVAGAAFCASGCVFVWQGSHSAAV